MKSIAPGSFISICPPKGHPSKRAGPFITIRASTFVELLGNAREWDAKFPALAGASRAYLLESFAFADDFCSYAAEEERRRRPGVLARQVKRFLLYGAVFLALLSPLPVAAQEELNAQVGARRWSEADPLWYVYWIWNPDNIAVAGFSITPKAYQTVWVTAPGWEAFYINNAVVFVSQPGYEIQPGTWGCCFMIYYPTYNDDVVDHTLIGVWYSGAELGKATLGAKTYGHAAY